MRRGLRTNDRFFDPVCPGAVLPKSHRRPEVYPIFEEQEFSPYLKEHVFDKPSENGTFNLEQLDLTAFEMKHVLPANMPKAVKRVHANWAEGFNAKVKKIAAASKCVRTFF